MLRIAETDYVVNLDHQGGGGCNAYTRNGSQQTYRFVEWCLPGYFTDGTCFLQEHLPQTDELFKMKSQCFLAILS